MTSPQPDAAAATVVATARTWLFVPGHRPERFSKAVSSGSDLVVVDLEDSVPLTDKDEARSHAVAVLARGDHVVVRVNDPRTPVGDADIEALSSASGVVVVMVPKSEDPTALRAVIDRLPSGSSVVALIETASGVANVERIAGVDGIARLAFGHLDLCAQLGIHPADQTALSPARFALVAASAIHGLPAPIDGVCTEFRELGEIRRDARASLSAGFAAKLCIHPAQVPAVHEAFAPTADEMAWAQAVVDSLAQAGASQVDGQMVDRPVLLRAEALLARARAN